MQANGSRRRSHEPVGRLHLLHGDVLVAAIPVRLALQLPGGERQLSLYFAAQVSKILSSRGQMHKGLGLLPIVGGLISARFGLEFGVLHVEERRGVPDRGVRLRAREGQVRLRILGFEGTEVAPREEGVLLAVGRRH